MKQLLSIFLLVIAVGCKFTNFDEQCIVGKRYFICSPDYRNNPFETGGKADVIIIAKKKGYVQYVWVYDTANTNAVKFNRSCEDFVWLINRCNQ